MKKFTMIASASLLAISGTVFAEQTLTEAQMDGVSAGAVVFLQATAGAGSYGNVVSNLLGQTATETDAVADPTGALTTTLGFAGAYGASTSVGTSVTNGAGIGGVLAQSESGAASSLF